MASQRRLETEKLLGVFTHVLFPRHRQRKSWNWLFKWERMHTLFETTRWVSQTGSGVGRRPSTMVRKSSPPLTDMVPSPESIDPLQPTASALFARRLMHYCSAELEPSSAPPSPRPTASRPQFSFSPHMKPQTSHQTPLFSNSKSIFEELETQRIRQQELEEDLLDSLDELSEGIDVLQILERAYDQTIKTHVVSPSPSPPPSTSLSKHSNAYTQNPSVPSQGQPRCSEPIPLMSGSSTALLAVLDHAPQLPANSDSSMTTLSLVSSSACPPLSSSAPATSSPISNYAAGTLHPSIFLDNDQTPSCDAVIRIAHIGDCMGMLVRDEEIIWRSEEMWWDVSMSVSLLVTGHLHTIPVQHASAAGSSNTSDCYPFYNSTSLYPPGQGR